MSEQVPSKKSTDILLIVVIIAIVLGAATTFFFIYIDKDSYSAIYIVPDSIVHNKANNTVMYTYGVISSESGTMDYALNVYLGDTLVKAKQFSLNKGEELDERDRISLPEDIRYPSKVSLRLTSRTTTEEVHFWLNG